MRQVVTTDCPRSFVRVEDEIETCVALAGVTDSGACYIEVHMSSKVKSAIRCNARRCSCLPR
jgi:hypothetical protein